MILVNIAGGLGNQMFQFAYGCALAKTTGQEVRYCVDSLSTYAATRSLELENAFELSVPCARAGDIAAIIGRWRSAPAMRRALARPQATALRGKHFVAEHGFTFMPDLTEQVRAGAYLHGYWQSARYFEMHDAAIRQAFQFKSGLGPENKAAATLISEGPSIAIHVRRGDYAANPKALAMHGVIEPDYYIAAIKRLRASTPNARVFAFSDDPNWVRATILSQIENSECVEHNTGHQSFRDMQLMTMCDHLVIANSSFSWWAAWLNNKRKKTVIAPKQWFADPALADNSVVPAQWLRM